MTDLSKDEVLALAKDMADDAGSPWTSLVPVGQERLAEAVTRGLGCQVYWLARARFVSARIAAARAEERERAAKIATDFASAKPLQPALSTDYNEGYENSEIDTALEIARRIRA